MRSLRIEQNIMNIININLPFTEEIVRTLKKGDKLLLSGKLITARDAAHKRMIEALNRGEKLPFDIRAYPLYYCGPTPAKEGYPIGSCGPTTSSRMDSYVAQLFSSGLRYMIGKGKRNAEVIDQIKQHNGLYLIAIGGAGALYAKCVEECKCIAYEDLGSEAIYELRVKKFPVYVWII